MSIDSDGEMICNYKNASHAGICWGNVEQIGIDTFSNKRIFMCQGHKTVYNDGRYDGYYTKESDLVEKKETVNHPPHYSMIPAKCKQCGEEIECIDVVRHLDFNTGNAIKYLWRAEFKGNSVEDLRKAIWYIENQIELLEEKTENKPHSFGETWKDIVK